MQSATTPPPLMSALNSPTALARAEHAERELRITRLRNRILLRAAQGAIETARIAVVHGDAVVEPTLRIARLLEAQGRVPVVRFARGADNEIVGIELSVCVGATPTPCVSAIEMTVVESDEEIGALLPRGVTT